MPKKKTALTIEERLQQALVPAEEQPYEVPENWVWVRLIGNVNSCLDGYRKPINSSERAKRVGKVPYYGATGQVGWIDDYLTNEHLVLLGEDGAPFLDLLKDKAYIIFGEAWVNNHAHILKSYFGEIGNVFLMHYLNMVDYKDYVKGTTRLKLTQGSMQLMPFPLPPLSEQQRIVERIEELFAKLDETKERLQEVADSFAVRKAAILHKAFTGELTKQWRRENGVSDESWEEVSLKELSSVIGDGLHGTPVYSENGDYYFINGNNFDDSFIAIKESTKRVSIEEYKKYAVNLNDNTVFLSINGTLGKTAFYNGEPVILGKSACYINVGEKLDKRFLKEMFHTNAFINYANQKATGSTIKNLGLKAIREYLVPLPSLPEQHEIVRLIDDLLARERAGAFKAGAGGKLKLNKNQDLGSGKS